MQKIQVQKKKVNKYEGLFLNQHKCINEAKQKKSRDNRIKYYHKNVILNC